MAGFAAGRSLAVSVLDSPPWRAHPKIRGLAFNSRGTKAHFCGADSQGRKRRRTPWRTLGFAAARSKAANLVGGKSWQPSPHRGESYGAIFARQTLAWAKSWRESLRESCGAILRRARHDPVLLPAALDSLGLLDLRWRRFKGQRDFGANLAATRGESLANPCGLGAPKGESFEKPRKSTAKSLRRFSQAAGEAGCAGFAT